MPSFQSNSKRCVTCQHCNVSREIEDYGQYRIVSVNRAIRGICVLNNQSVGDGTPACRHYVKWSALE